MTVSISGTSGGFKKLCRGEIDIANASRPILNEEMKECNKHGIQFIELPVAYDALTVVVNPQNNWANSMTVAELKKMWEPLAQGKITNWNQINPAWPNAPLKLLVRILIQAHLIFSLKLLSVRPSPVVSITRRLMMTNYW